MKHTLFVLILACSPCAAADKPLLIQWGQTTPDSTLLARHYQYWESYLPFDGIIVPINQKRYSGRYGSTAVNILPPEHWPLDHVAFHHRKIAPAEYQHVIDDLRSCHFKQFKHNFLGLTTYPHLNFAMDWFDDALWQNLLHNVGVLARTARQSGCQGIWFDTEQYGPPNVWHWRRLCQIMPNRATDFATYRNQVARRGEQFIRAINREFPGLTLSLAFGNCLLHDDVVNRPALKGKPFSHARSVLIAPFLDGILRAADVETTVIDAYELSYYYKTADQFRAASRIVRQACQTYSLVPELYARRIRVSFGLYPTRPGMFNARDFTNNRFQPAELRRAVSAAMQQTDKYVWIWNERTSFWIKGGPTGRPLLPLQPFVNSDNADASHLTASVTDRNAMRTQDSGIPASYLEAIAQGKREALRK
ncbi:MAG: hypothetical protein VX346_04060 [Planctomycetota bacterium]|nr:hypothetical protein [Planctomycetota bacterium]